MTDSLSSQMGRGRHAKRNKSTASAGGKRSRAQSVASVKFQPNVDGFSTFLSAVTRLGRNGNEFTWHDLRKVYHKEIQRPLTAEELNAIFSAKNLTKREIFELPKVKRFMTSMDGSMMCRFRLIADPGDFHDDEMPPLLPSAESGVIIQNTTDHSLNCSETLLNEKPIAISTDCDDKTAGPTSDLSKSDNSPSQQSLLQQASVTDDEGWVSGKDNRSYNSSPLELPTSKDQIDGSTLDLEDEVFEPDQRIAAGSDFVDGAVVTEAMVVEEGYVEQQLKKQEVAYVAPNVMDESIYADFKAVVQSDCSVNTTVTGARTAAEKVSVHAPPRKVVYPPVPAERTNVLLEELATETPIKKLIEKFDTAINFTEHGAKRDDLPHKSIYSLFSEEIGESEKSVNQSFSSSKKEEKEESEVTNVIFRSASTHSSIIVHGQEQLAEFVAEQEAKHSKKAETSTNGKTDEIENAFCVREQSSMSSLDREYFASKTNMNEDLFAELGVEGADGFQLKTVDSQESQQESSEIITVIETPSKSTEEKYRAKAESFESDADIPYSLCSEDEAEPMTMIENSMKPIQNAKKTLASKEDQKEKTVVVNVELNGQARRPISEDANYSIKDKIASFQAAVSNSTFPIAKENKVEEKEVVRVLNRSQELPYAILETKPSIQTSGSVHRRQVRFMRGCCIVQ